ncbi:hypothetical protein L6452_27905 [Arctium lappa]|uniref:Uncharacterized protein n=1 Tax=Arctium lappa TaxID=4217 RepID=A0ACB8ZW23_ARCLA|nr:hypothetical protein L6452_27905 [Arctium lappa]
MKVVIIDFVERISIYSRYESHVPLLLQVYWFQFNSIRAPDQMVNLIGIARVYMLIERPGAKALLVSVC